MHPNEIKNGIMAKYNIADPTDVRCSHCAHWGYNNGRIKTDLYLSRCLKRKDKTEGYCFCRLFQPIKERGKSNV